MAELTGAPLRVCDICGGVDTHPRHVIGHADGDAPEVDKDILARIIENEDLASTDRAAAVADIVDRTLQLRHMDCCRSVGCPDGTCDLIAATGAGDLRGEELREHLTSGAVDNLTEN